MSLDPKKTIHLIVAARPNFMKIAPLYHSLKAQAWAEPVIVHTGQHYDVNMSDAFFNDLHLPEPHHHLGIGSGTHAGQTGGVMIAYEKLLRETHPDMVVVVGDVNSTLACTLAAVKMDYPSSIKDRSHASERTSGKRPVVAHLESGLRSYDRTMPEEINRLVTDSLADLLWTPSPDGDENLLKEGISADKIERVGNIMIDSLEMVRKNIESRGIYTDYGLHPEGYGMVTLHRPSNVDRSEVLAEICRELVKISGRIPLVFPCHPRTAEMLRKSELVNLLQGAGNIQLVKPLGYIPFMNLVFNSRFVITDSGGIQEETTYIGKPCLTLRPNTERPITVSQGTNRLCKVHELENLVDDILNHRYKRGTVPDRWDGKTASRVVASMRRILAPGHA